MASYLAIGIIVLIVLCLVDLPRARSMNRTLYGYFLMNGQLRLGPFVATILSANLSIGNFLIFVASWGYLFGYGGIFWFTINLALNTVAYIVFIPAFRSYILDHTNTGTIHEFLAVTFRGGPADPNFKRLRLLASATTILGLLFAVIFEIHLASIMLAQLLKIDTVVIFSALTLVMCLYSGVGGFHTLRFTDIVQSWAMIIGTALIVPLLLGFWHSLPNAGAALRTAPFTLNIGWPNILSICVIGSGWFLVAMDQWQRVCAMRDPERTKTGMLIYFAIISLFGIVFGLLGAFNKLALEPVLPQALMSSYSKGANPLSDFFLLPAVAPQVSPVILAVFAVALLAAAMSTANTFLIVSGHSFVSDLLMTLAKRRTFHDLSASEQRWFLGVARGTIFGMTMFIIITWIVLTTLSLLTDPLSFFFIAYSIQFALLAPMVLARLPRKLWPSSGPVVISVLISVLSSLIGGFGMWILIQKGDAPILGLNPSSWLTLTPVIAVVMGGIPLFFGRRRNNGATEPINHG